MKSTEAAKAATLILCTAPKTDDTVADKLARGLVEQRLAACVNILPSVRSVYRWEDTLQCDEEQQLIIKTSRERVAAVVDWLTENHPYDVPEIIALPLSGGSAAYLTWLLQESKPTAAPPQSPMEQSERSTTS